MGFDVRFDVIRRVVPHFRTGTTETNDRMLDDWIGILEADDHPKRPISVIGPDSFLALDRK